MEKEGITIPSGEMNKAAGSAPIEKGSRDDLRKERTIYWMARKFGVAREDIKVTR